MLDEYEVIVGLLLLILGGVSLGLVLLFVIIRRIGKVSKTSDLSAAVDAILAFIQTLQAGAANTTPDADVQAQIDRLKAALPQS